MRMEKIFLWGVISPPPGTYFDAAFTFDLQRFADKTVGTFAELKTAIEGATEGDVISLSANLDAVRLVD